MKKVCHYFSLELATISTKLHQAPLAAVQNDARQTRNTEKEECFFLEARMVSTDQITLGSFKAGVYRPLQTYPWEVILQKNGRQTSNSFSIGLQSCWGRGQAEAATNPSCKLLHILFFCKG